MDSRILVICFSTNSSDKHEIKNCLTIAKQHNGIPAAYVHDQLYILPDQTEKIALSDKLERIVLTGHGDRKAFGDKDYHPKELAQLLIRLGLPKTVQKIDLLSCQVGDIVDGECYAYSFADFLAENGYPDIQVNTFLTQVTDFPISDTRLTSHDVNTKFELKALTYADKRMHDKELEDIFEKKSFEELEKLLEQFELEKSNLLERKRELEDQIREGKTERKLTDELAQIDKKLIDLESKGQKIFKLYNEYDIESDRVYKKYFQYVYTCEDILHALDHNPNFQISRKSRQEMKQLQDERTEGGKERINAIIILNTHIAILQETLDFPKRSLLSWVFSSSQQIKRENEFLRYQIAEFSKLREVLKDPAKNLEDIKNAIGKIVNDKRLVTADNEEILKRLPRMFDHYIARVISL